MMKQASRLAALRRGVGHFSISSSRTYATATATASSSTSARKETVQLGQLGKTGCHVGTIDVASPVASLSIVAKAGPRYQQHGEEGLAAVLRDIFFKSTEKRSTLRIVREAELRGHHISTTADREILYFTVEFFKEDLPLVTDLLTDALHSALVFDKRPSGIYTEEYVRRAHELKDITSRLKHEAEAMLHDTDALMSENLHRIAFRSGLGATLHPDHVPTHTLAALKEYTTRHLTAGNVAFVGVGVSQEALQAALASTDAALFPTGKAASNTASSYHGGEARIATLSHGDTDYALAFEGTSASSAEAPALAALTAYLGGAVERVKWSPGVSALSQVSDATGVRAQAFNVAYSDAGLFGLRFTGECGRLRPALDKGIEALKKVAEGKVDAKELTRAVSQAKFDALSAVETRAGRTAFAGKEILSRNMLSTAQQIGAGFDQLNGASIVKLAKKTLASKPTVSVVGDVFHAPYLDTLKLT